MKTRKPDIFNKRIPTILGVMVLIGGLVSGILLVGKPQGLLTRAGPTSIPKEVKISNKKPESVTVSWITDIPVTGLLKYSDNPGNLSLPAADVRDQVSGKTGLFITHYVVLTNLEADRTYYFEIVSGSASYDDGGKPYQIRTSAKGSLGAKDVISGKIVSSEGQGVDGAVVYVEIDGAETLSALTKNGGVWQLNLGEARDKKGRVVAYDRQNQQISVFVQGGALGTATALTNTANDSPVDDIVMGTNVNLVEEAIPVGGANERASSFSEGAGFGQLADEADSGQAEITEDEKLINPGVDGEEIATSSPEFKGKLPKGTSVKITVNSEVEQTATVTTGEDGYWTWTPPIGLEPGEHTVTVEYEDGNGVWQKLTRSFVVLAAEKTEGLPAFTATGSAEVTPEVTIPDEGSSSSMPSTESGVPEAGVLTSTVWLLIVGLGLFFTGQYLKRWTKTI